MLAGVERTKERQVLQGEIWDGFFWLLKKIPRIDSTDGFFTSNFPFFE